MLIKWEGETFDAESVRVIENITDTNQPAIAALISGGSKFHRLVWTFKNENNINDARDVADTLVDDLMSLVNEHCGGTIG